MTKYVLAQQLRQRQRAKKILPPDILAILDQISDDEIIDSYITCNHCGERQVKGKQLGKIIYESHCDENFFNRCNAADESTHQYIH